MSPVSLGSGPTEEEPQLDFDFLIAQAIWFDILACVSTGRVPRIPYQQWLEVSKLDMSSFMGCYNWVMVAIADLAHLQAWKKVRKRQGTLSVPELVKRSGTIETKLRNDIAELGLVNKVSIGGIAEMAPLHTDRRLMTQ